MQYVVLGETFQSEERDLHRYFVSCLTKLKKQTLFVFMTE